MARNRTLATLTALVVASSVASAQTLARLHVRSMDFSAHPDRVRTGEPLRLVLRVALGEHVAQLDNVTLPDLTGFDVLGDERRCVQVLHTTECTETLTVTASAAGVYTIAPPTLDALDVRSGHPLRYAANSVRVTVTGASLLGRVGAGALWRSVGRAIGTVVVILLALGAGLLAWLALTRRRKQQPVSPAFAIPPDVAADGRATRWNSALDALRAHPTRESVRTVRTLLRDHVGARADETFGELAARGLQLEQPSAMEALRLVERAAFIEDSRIPAAVAEALPLLDAVPPHRLTY
ncbi:MAG: hypothetical protein JO043_13140 [Candidatus Eremiobacteraeota bacterium]|nr:hypothetical protein [Candidatus Eremiobacteraeota bacterium]